MYFSHIIVADNAPAMWSRSGLTDMNRCIMSRCVFLPQMVLQASTTRARTIRLPYTYCGLSPQMSATLYRSGHWVIYDMDGEDRVWYTIHDKYIKVALKDPDEADTPLGRLLQRYPLPPKQPKIAGNPRRRKS